MQIETARLILRPARESDLDDMHAVLSSPEATRWWSTPPHESLDLTREWLAAMIAGGGAGLDMVIERDGRVIGKAGFYRPPELGYILHPDHWGQGLATEALTAVLDRLFAATDHAAVNADVDPDNAASIRVVQKLGFVRTGFGERTWNVGGVWKDSIFYGLSREAWAARARP